VQKAALVETHSQQEQQQSIKLSHQKASILQVFYIQW
jgi:hypothetical protein